jgi:hypothetical protein
METLDELLHGHGTIFNCGPFVIGQWNLYQHPLQIASSFQQLGSGRVLR